MINRETNQSELLLNKDLTEACLKFYNDREIKNFNDFSELLSVSEREICLNDIEEDTGDEIDTLIRFYNHIDDILNIPIEDRIPIKLFIDSVGGVVTSALTICDSIEMSKTPVWTINQGCAYSGGALVFIYGHRRITYPSGTFLFHEGSGGMNGDAGKFQNYADFYKSLRSVLKNKCLSKTKIPPELWDKHEKDDWWLFAEEALELGIADELATYETVIK